MCSSESASAGSAGAGMATQVGGTVIAASGARAAGRAEQSYYQYLATQNEIQALDLTDASNKNMGVLSGAVARENSNLNRSVSALKGTQTVAMAANGVYGNSKTAEDISRDTMSKAELDRAAIRENANLQADQMLANLKGEQASLRRQSGQYRMAGENARTAGEINAATSILNGATQVSSNYYQWNKTSKGKGSDKGKSSTKGSK